MQESWNSSLSTCPLPDPQSPTLPPPSPRFFSRFVPAYSPRLLHRNGAWQLMPPRANSSADAADPIWAESFWDHLSCRVYLKDSAAVDWAVLLIGVGWTAVMCWGAAWVKGVVVRTLA